MKTVYTLHLLQRAKWMFMSLVLVVMCFPYQDARAGQAPVNLGSAASFAVLAFNTITNTSGGTINGDVGVSPGTAFDAGDPPVIVNGEIHLGDPVALQARADLTTAYNNAAGLPGAIAATADIGGQTLPPGLYQAPVSLAITGNLTIDAQGDQNAVWIFRMASTLTAANNARVILVNGAQARNVFWQVGSSATLGTNAVVKGSILAAASITLQTGARLDGRALARDGAVTLDANTITRQPWGEFPWPMFVPAITGKKI